MEKSKFLKITSIMLIATSCIMAFLSLIIFIISFTIETNKEQLYFTRYLSINTIKINIGCTINFAAAALGVFSGLCGIKSWTMRNQANLNMLLGIATGSITILGFICIISGMFLFALFLIPWILFQLAIPVLHSIGAYRFKSGNPISMSSKYGNYGNPNYCNSAYVPNRQYSCPHYAANGYDRNREYIKPKYNNSDGNGFAGTKNSGEINSQKSAD